ncbi:hypothetical protein DCM91_00010 [Chitinophaga costaii]|nr:hypothetical protein DCM91_00010 [Chitinophaga costaii]
MIVEPIKNNSALQKKLNGIPARRLRYQEFALLMLNGWLVKFSFRKLLARNGLCKGSLIFIKIIPIYVKIVSL